MLQWECDRIRKWEREREWVGEFERVREWEGDNMSEKVSVWEYGIESVRGRERQRDKKGIDNSRERKWDNKWDGDRA